MNPKNPTRYRAHTRQLNSIINKAKVLKKQFPEDEALTFTIKQYMHIKKQLTTHEINEYEGCVIFINKKRGFFRLDDLELKIFFADKFRKAIYKAPKDTIFYAMVEETKRDKKVVTRELISLKDSGRVRKEIDIEALRACFENNAIFELDDLERLYRHRHDYSPIKRARWVFAKGLRPRNFYNKTKARVYGN